MNKRERLFDAFIIVLSLPLIIFATICHLYELVLMKNSKWKDRLFMRRFNIIDEQHVSDFIEWNDEYIGRRE